MSEERQYYEPRCGPCDMPFDGDERATMIGRCGHMQCATCWTQEGKCFSCSTVSSDVQPFFLPSGRDLLMSPDPLDSPRIRERSATESEIDPTEKLGLQGCITEETLSAAAAQLAAASAPPSPFPPSSTAGDTLSEERQYFQPRCGTCDLPFDGNLRTTMTGSCGHLQCATCWKEKSNECYFCKMVSSEVQPSFLSSARDLLMSPDPLDSPRSVEWSATTSEIDPTEKEEMNNCITEEMVTAAAASRRSSQTSVASASPQVVVSSEVWQKNSPATYASSSTRAPTAIRAHTAASAPTAATTRVPAAAKTTKALTAASTTRTATTRAPTAAKITRAPIAATNSKPPTVAITTKADTKHTTTPTATKFLISNKQLSPATTTACASRNQPIPTPTDDMATITVNCINNRKVKMTVDTANFTVWDVKVRVQQETGISTERQTLLFKGKLMSDDTRTLKSYSVPNGTTLQMSNKTCTSG